MGAKSLGIRLPSAYTALVSGTPKGDGLGADITRGALYLLVVSSVGSLAYLLTNQTIQSQIVRWAIATPNSVWGEYEFWKLLTSPLVEIEFISALLHAFMLWKFLPQLERWWGKKRFLLFALYTSLTGATVGTLVGYLVGSGDAIVAGLSPFVFAGIIAFGRVFSNQKVQFFAVVPLTGRQLTIGMAGLALVMLVFGKRWAHGAAMVSAMALAFLITEEKFSLKLWWLKRKQAKIRRKLKVVPGQPDDDPGKRWMN